MLTEVPQSMKRLVRLVARGFYSIEHALVIDMLVRHPCIKEDDMLELLKFDRKQLRSVINTLKSEKFIKVRMRVETDSEGKTTRHNYYFISYIMFVNVVKYKLDHIRRKIEMEERDNTSRASFRCDDCQKTFTDLEADQLFDFYTQTFKCTICQNEVVEDESAINRNDARTLLAKFNEQIQPLYDLLRECEDVRLAPELMEPEPTDIRATQKTRNTKSAPDTDKWSGDATKDKMFGYTDTSVSVKLNEEKKADREAPKQQPVWMTQSTVDGVPVESAAQYQAGQPAEIDEEQEARPDVSREIENLLMIHEKKSNPSIPGIPSHPAADESDSSDSDVETSQPAGQSNEAVQEMDSDGEEEEVVMVTVAGTRIPLSDVTDEMVARMSLEEKAEYIRVGQEMYKDIYE